MLCCRQLVMTDTTGATSSTFQQGENVFLKHLVKQNFGTDASSGSTNELSIIHLIELSGLHVGSLLMLLFC